MAVKEMLRESAQKTKKNTGHTRLYAEDFMDDGSKIALKIEIDETHVRYKSLILRLHENLPVRRNFE